jgi:hypothetical protein
MVFIEEINARKEEVRSVDGSDERTVQKRFVPEVLLDAEESLGMSATRCSPHLKSCRPPTMHYFRIKRLLWTFDSVSKVCTRFCHSVT